LLSASLTFQKGFSVTQEVLQPFPPRKRGRPPGRQLDSAVHIRLPQPVMLALKLAAGELRIPTSALLRRAIVQHLVPLLHKYIGVVRNSSLPSRERLRALEALKLCQIGVDQLSPFGIKIVRARAKRAAKSAGLWRKAMRRMWDRVASAVIEVVVQALVAIGNRHLGV